MILTIQEILNLEAQGKLEEAYQSIVMALSSNLFSPSEEKELKDIMHRILEAMPLKEKPLSVAEAFEMIVHDDDAFAGLLVLEKTNLRHETERIQRCFDEGVSALANALLLQLCVEQQLPATFTYHHPSGVKCEVIPATLTPLLDCDVVNEGLAMIHDYFASDNPSLMQLIIHQFMMDVSLLYPIETDESEYDTIVLESIKATYLAMQDEAGFNEFMAVYPKQRQNIVN
ncbi:MAG: hypothetical protein KGZ84_03365 [Erysipelotrichia bacterium]|jgi:hypothetical protein|nr:hypothetical protein [Erysipelotrichia bacterium]